MLKKKINRTKILCYIVTIFSLLFFYILFPNINSVSYLNTKNIIFLFSWVGILVYLYILYTWKILTNKYITLYTLFITFFLFFNFGQPIIWSLGIHVNGEIGSTNLYYTLSTPDHYDIMQTQLLVIISAIMIHAGAIFFKKVKITPIVKKKNKSETSILQKHFFSFSLLLSPIIIFSKFYILVINFLNSQIYGYTALYYDSSITGANTIFKILSRLFFPILVGLLIGSNYKPKIVRLVYIVFLLNITLSFLGGDRGGWIYSLLILIILHHFYYKKIKLKQAVLVICIGILLMYLSVGVVAVRNNGVSLEGIIKAIKVMEVNPIIKTVSSLGQTMGVTTALVMKGWDIYPYGNTFFYGLLTAPSNKVIDILNLDYVSLGSWFSQHFLGISNGAGFSIIAEVLLNFGPYFLPLIMIIFGVFIYFITDIEGRDLNKETPYIIFCVITTSITINISRNVFSYNVGEFLYTTVQFFTYYKIYKTILISKTNKKTDKIPYRL